MQEGGVPIFKAPLRNFHFALIVAQNVARVYKSSTAYCCKDLVQCEYLFWKRVKETRRLFAQ